MYVAKGQLQNAADSAALAGVASLETEPNPANQGIARTQAVSFANKNVAAGSPVAILSDGTNTLSEDNDITVGYWTGTSYTSNGTPVNAIQVRARRCC